MKIGALDIRLKICGMRDESNIRDVSALGPDYMGFIFYSQSKRAVGGSFGIPADFPQQVKRVGVFVNESPAVMIDKARQHSLDLIQLHGEETPSICAELKDHGLGVIKALSIDEHSHFENANPFKRVVDFFLFDTKGRGYGGTGRVFDWNLLKKYDQQVPFFLGGGLSPSNINQVESLAGMNIHAIDLNSGVELQPGLKDVALIRKLINPPTSSADD